MKSRETMNVYSKNTYKDPLATPEKHRRKIISIIIFIFESVFTIERPMVVIFSECFCEDMN